MFCFEPQTYCEIGLCRIRFDARPLKADTYSFYRKFQNSFGHLPVAGAGGADFFEDELNLGAIAGQLRGGRQVTVAVVAGAEADAADAAGASRAAAAAAAAAATAAAAASAAVDVGVAQASERRQREIQVAAVAVVVAPPGS